ncbi:rhomboid family intramembrane serine protease [Thermolongibacillus altinsuensis]
MNIRFDFVYWQLILQFLHQHYQIIRMANHDHEVWLESTRNRKAPVIRLVRYDIDWSSWLQRDMEYAAHAAEQLRKKQFRRRMDVLNIYITTYPPVDDWTFRIARPIVAGERRIVMQTMVIHHQNMDAMLQQLSHLFQHSFSIQLPEESPYIEYELEWLKQKTLSFAEEQLEREKKIFEHGKPFFTYLFMAAQIAMFFFLEWKGGSTNTLTLIQYGAKFNPLILEGEWWRFFTPIVLHIGFAHLFMNTLALYYLGPMVEKLYGPLRFLFIYLFAGFFGSLASFLFTSSVSAGASGAIFGCFGALLYFGIVHPPLFFRTIGVNILTVIGINLLFGLVVPGIDNAGHIGGLIGGFLASSVVHLPKQRWHKLRLLSFGVTALLTALCLYIGFHRPFAEDPKLLVALSQQYIEQKQYDRAYDLLKFIDADDAFAAESYFLRSYIEIQRKEYEAAKKHLQLAIKKNPQFHEAFYNLALLYLEEKNYEQAKEAASRAARLEPNNKSYQRLLRELEQLD